MCVSVSVCVRTTPKVLEFLSPALKSERGWAPSPSLSLSLSALLFFSLSLPAGQRGGEDSQSGGGTEDRSCFQPTLSLSLSLCVLFPASLSSCLTFTCSLLWQILFQCSARRESKALSVSHTHTLLFLSTPLPLPQSRGKVSPSLCHPAAVSFPCCYDSTCFITKGCVGPSVCVFLSAPANLPADVVIRIRVRLG